MHEEPKGIEPGLRMTSDTLLAMLDEIHALETAKRELDPSSHAFGEHARRVEALAVTVLEQSREQSRLAGDAQGTGIEERPIEAIPPRPLHEVLSDWRDAERALAGAEPGSEEADQLRSAIRRLRAEYRRAHDIALERSGD